MGLTWKDGISTLFMGAIAVIYLAFLHGTDLWLISSARGTTTAVFLLGMVGGCMLSGRRPLPESPVADRPRLAGDRRRVGHCRTRCRSGRARQRQHGRTCGAAGRHGRLVARSDHAARANAPVGDGAQP